MIGRAVVALSLSLAAGGQLAADAPVAAAARQGDLEAVRQLLRSGADVNAAEGDGMTALHWAAQRGDVPLGEVLIYAGASVAAGTRIGRYTPLHIAARRGQAGMVELLLEAGADPNATTNSGATPLHLGAASGEPAVVASLLKRGARVNAREAAWEQTPLVFAAARNRVEVIRVLLEAGADPALTSRAVDVAEREEADRAAERRLAEFLAGFKEKEGGEIDWRPRPSQVQAAIQGAREIQRKWPDVPKPGQDDETEKKGEGEAANAKPEDEKKPVPVKYNAEGQPVNSDTAQAAPDDQPPAAPAQEDAAKPGPVKYNAEGEPVYPDAVKKEERAKPLTYGQMVGSWGGLTPLLHAVRQGHHEAALALLDGGADINQPSAGDGTTPLLMAAINGQFDLALTLLARGADPNLAGDAGTTPLFAVLERTWAPRASYSHPMEHQQQQATHLEVMEALLEAGADPNVPLKKHLWYMEYTFGVLRRAGINLKGATPFWRAAHALDVDAMRLLKRYGADPDIPTIKPPERRRRPPQAEDKPKPEKAKQKAPDQAAEAGEKNPKADKESAGPQPEESQEKEEEKDHSGIPPVPVGGPNLYPIHVAAGAGYGQAFAGNAHRHVPGGWLAAVKFLIEECGAEVDTRDAGAYTALHHAASRGDNELVLYLVEKGADVTVVSRKGQTTADMANGPIQRVPPYPETIALLVKLGAKNNNNCVSC